MRQELAPRTGIAIDRLASLLLSNRLGGTEWAGRPGLIQNNSGLPKDLPSAS